jgi:inhibitor of KinA
LGDQGVLVYFDNRISGPVVRRVQGLSRSIRAAGWPWVRDIVPSYRCLAVFYDPVGMDYETAASRLAELADTPRAEPAETKALFELPTVYGGVHGPDLAVVAHKTGLNSRQVVEVFADTEFTIYFLGFIGAQPYLGGLPQSLAVPRLAKPRTRMPCGSVGIGGPQAGVITIDQPSGYHFIGRTLVALYDPGRTPPSPFQPGDRLKFVPVHAEQALAHQSRWPQPIRQDV